MKKKLFSALAQYSLIFMAVVGFEKNSQGESKDTESFFKKDICYGSTLFGYVVNQKFNDSRYGAVTKYQSPMKINRHAVFELSKPTELKSSDNLDIGIQYLGTKKIDFEKSGAIDDVDFFRECTLK